MSGLGYHAEAARADAIASEHYESKAAFMAASALGDADAIAAASARYKTARDALINARAERSVAGLRAEHDALADLDTIIETKSGATK